ncbi:PLC-like phosphodiesterase [Chaetomium sp. MPI-SDFR-AT-0129]|nr:PLC-like phosphodiesterase [Chaetomium sp. MPI-SDFR-AT-0129]
MVPESLQARRARPGQVKTDLVPQTQLVVIPPSAVSNSSLSTASLRGSPAQSVETVGTAATTGSSLQASPEFLDTCYEKELEDLDPLGPPFRLPEAVNAKQPTEPAVTLLSRRTSSTSLGQPGHRTPGTSAMGEAMKMSIVRRASNTIRRATGLVARRPSSTHPTSRDGSVGPGVIRRRGSMSNPNTPYEAVSTFDSDDDEFTFSADDRTDRTLPDTGSASLNSSSSLGLIPLAIRQGTTLAKVAKNKNTKQITLSFDLDTASVRWGRNKYFNIDDVVEVRKAPDIRQYRLDAGLLESVEPRFFTIIYMPPGKTSTKVLHLIAQNDESFQLWIEALDTIPKQRQLFAAKLMSLDSKAMRTWWRMEMERQLGRMRSAEDEHIDLADAERLCRSLFIHASSEEVQAKFNLVRGTRSSLDDAPGSPQPDSRLNFDEFVEFMRLIVARSDSRTVFRAHTRTGASKMTKAEFFRFLREAQQENVDDDLAIWDDIFTGFARKGRPRGTDKQEPAGEEELTMSEASFTAYLTSAHNGAIPRQFREYVLDRPLNEYYISSSHNTYLIGRQVGGVSSTEGYIAALKGGCRCVEVDCWDGENNQPVVTHGHALTTRISFQEVINTINNYAFSTSHFPLWISLEVRCSQNTQINMAKIMIDTFGDKLVRAPLDPTSDRLPSPSELMDRILIKVKKANEGSKGLERPMGRRRGNSMPTPYQRSMTLDSMPVPVPSSPLLSPALTSRSNRQINTITEGLVHEPASSGPSECDSESDIGAVKRPQSKIHPVLGELGVYCMGIHFDGFDSPDAKRFNHIFSFKEKTFAEKNQPSEEKRALYRHNMRYLMRVYPDGQRIQSSNFNPLIYWKRGVQMAALNWQTFDTGMQLNRAMFEGGTAESGYVLKPLEGRQIQVMPNLTPDECMGKRPRKQVSFEIEIISAQQLMRPTNLSGKRTMDPYIQVEVMMADDKRNKGGVAVSATGQQMQLKQRTKIVRDNGFNPQFNDTFTFDVTTKYPDLIFVQFAVRFADKGGYNDKSPHSATFTGKLCNFKQGYRTIRLLDDHGDFFEFAALFCRIKKGPVTDIMVSYPEDVPKNANNKLKNISNLGRNVFTNSSPKSSLESGRTA